MTALAVFAVSLAVGTWWAITVSERSRDIDSHVSRFLTRLDRDER